MNCLSNSPAAMNFGFATRSAPAVYNDPAYFDWKMEKTVRGNEVASGASEESLRYGMIAPADLVLQRREISDMPTDLALHRRETSDTPADLLMPELLSVGPAYFLLSNEFGSEEDEDFDSEVDEDWEEEEEETMTNQLLDFASSVTDSLQRIFNRNAMSEDFCDVYEDKFRKTVSGRELYYADLLAMAQSGDGYKKSTKSATITQPPNHTVLMAKGEHMPCSQPHTGHANGSGLGPFQELFDYAAAKQHLKTNTTSNSTSWEYRKFPQSFWEEPGSLMKGGRTLDFSDLLAGWTNECPAYS